MTDNLPSESKDIYSSTILVEKSPAEGIKAIQLRKSQIKETNHQIAEWLTSYGRLRLRYVDTLNKLLKEGETIFTDPSNQKLQNKTIDSLGLCAPMWDSVLKIAHDETKYFDSTTRMMGRDMIAPLKLYTRRNDGSLANLPELTNVASKIEETGDGPSGSSAKTEWSERAPQFFATFEQYDYNRLILLKDVFLKYQTEISDVLASIKKHNEAGIEHVLSFNPNDEINRFCRAAEKVVIPAKVDNSQRLEGKDVSSPHELSAGVKGTSLTAVPSSDGTIKRRTVVQRPVSKRMSIFGGYLRHNEKSKESPERSRSNSLGSVPEVPAARRASAASSAFSLSTFHHDQKPNKKKRHSKFGRFLHRHKKDKQASARSRSSSITESSEAGSIATEHTKHEHSSTPLKKEITNEVAPSKSADKDVTVKQADQKLPEQKKAEKQTKITTSFPAMRPTKLVGSTNEVNSESAKSMKIKPVERKIDPKPVEAKPVEAKPVEAPETVPAKPNQVESPEITSAQTYATPTTQAKTAASPPIPPSSRKTMTDTVPPIKERNPRAAPVPPAQRRSISESLVPAKTGSLSAQGTGLAGNVTGGGGLISGQIVHPSLTKPGLNASIVELFNASFKGGECVRSNAMGEIAFSYILDGAVKKIPTKINLKIESKSKKELPNFVVNTLFLDQQGASNGIFVISDPSQINLRTVGGLKYMLNGPSAPLIVQPVWKHEATKSTVIISLRISPSLDDFLKTHKIILSNVLVSVAIHGATATAAATKPAGSFNKRKNRVTWNLPAGIVFDSVKKEERLIARFITDGLAKESDSGVQVRFTINNDEGASIACGLNNDLVISAKTKDPVEDPFSSATNVNDSSTLSSEWSHVPTLKTIVAGGYSGHD